MVQAVMLIKAGEEVCSLFSYYNSEKGKMQKLKGQKGEGEIME